MTPSSRTVTGSVTVAAPGAGLRFARSPLAHRTACGDAPPLVASMTISHHRKQQAVIDDKHKQNSN